jgi:hypothetical protein
MVERCSKKDRVLISITSFNISCTHNNTSTGWAAITAAAGEWLLVSKEKVAR